MKKYFFLLALGIIILVYRFWFLTGIVEGGDLRYIFEPVLKGLSLFPYAWSGNLNNGFGGNNSPFLVGYYNDALISFFSRYVMADWGFISRITQILPYLLLAIPNLFLFRKIFKNDFVAFLATIIYFCNTYILMVTGGGQMLIAIAYALVPIVFMQFVKLINHFFANKQGSWTQKLRLTLLAGILFGIQVMVDIRIAYVTLLAIMLYFAIVSIVELVGNVHKSKNIIVAFFTTICVPLGITFFLNIFWILPTILTHQNPIEQLGSAYSSIDAVKFFSFAKFENTMALLHPNWPENIFGKVYFMRPEFLLMPILAFTSLFFVKNIKEKQEKIYIIFFVCLGLIGAFLAKGASDPLGQIYLFLFAKVPGFSLFRDSTKWYVLVAFSFSMLVSFAVWKIYQTLDLKLKVRDAENRIKMSKCVPGLFIVLVVGYLLFLVKPALLGQLTGTFKPHGIPADYVKFDQFITSQNSFFRTFWVPTLGGFATYSSQNPAVLAQNYFNSTDDTAIVKRLNNPATIDLLSEAGVKYVIVPDDSRGEIFLEDRKYSDSLYKKVARSVSKISYLKKITSFGKIVIYEIPNSKDHFWSTSKNLSLSYKYVNPVKYVVSVKNAKRGDRIIFVENYDSKWVASNANAKMDSVLFDSNLNSFILPSDGSYSLSVDYTPQKYVNIGLIINAASLVVIIVFLGLAAIKKK